MINTMRKLTAKLVLATLTTLVASVPVVAQSNQYTLKMENNTGFDIQDLRLSPTTSTVWGRDILGFRILQDGSTFTITNILPGRYDIRFVDEDGDVCTLHGVNIYRPLDWNLTQNWLLSCEL